MADPSDHDDQENRVRRPLLLRSLFELLAEQSQPISPDDAIAGAGARVGGLTEYEESRSKSGARRGDTYLRFASGWASKAGWLAKRGGWSITQAGVDALDKYPPAEFYSELSRTYRGSRDSTSHPARQPDQRWNMVQSALGILEPGSWTSYGDLAELTGLSARSVGTFLSENTNVPNVHRVLQSTGAIASGFQWADPDRTDDPREVLEREGLEFGDNGKAISEQRVSAEEFRSMLADMESSEPVRRAWLVRGSSVNGNDLVPVWLSKGSVSLAASRLRLVHPGIAKEELKLLVESDYAHQSYSARAEKLDEFYAFLSRMHDGDLVATTSQGRLFLGEIAGEATYHASSDGRSNLRRAVRWHTPSTGIDVAALPPEVDSRLRAQRDVIDLTQQLDLLSAMLDQDAAAPETPLSGPPVLRAATQELADSLLVDREWLNLCIDLLNDRPQLIFYGPPGTGKTFLAQALARHVADDHVKLVQFHPAYSYEDFFEGYRPTPSGTFELRPGPLRKLVDQAEDDPTTPYVLIIDEINRGNLAKIFGELYFLLEYRDQDIDLLYASGDDSKGFQLPKNVFIIGTMNTADRSIALVDSAMRRRFAFLPLHPSEEPTNGILRRWLRRHQVDPSVADLVDELNSRIQDPDFKIGPSYFMREAVHRDHGLERVWKTAILPLLDEHHYGDAVDPAHLYGLDRLRSAVAAKTSAGRASLDDGSSDATHRPD